MERVLEISNLDYWRNTIGRYDKVKILEIINGVQLPNYEEEFSRFFLNSRLVDNAA